MTEEEIRIDERQKIQKWIDGNSIYRVEFGHYNYSNDNPYYWWQPLRTHKINIMEVLK